MFGEPGNENGSLLVLNCQITIFISESSYEKDSRCFIVSRFRYEKPLCFKNNWGEARGGESRIQRKPSTSFFQSPFIR